jgi:hypothetical protein
MYEHLLQLALADNIRRGHAVVAPASEDRLEVLRRTFHREFGIEAPEPYRRLLRIVDGLDFNGLEVFSSHCSREGYDPKQSIMGFEYGNLSLRVAPYCDRILYFGFDSITEYALKLDSGRYEALDASLNIIRAHAGFDEMITWALFEALYRPPELRPPGGQPDW